MAKNLLAEYQGFIKFFQRAKEDILRWFEPHCSNDPSRIVFLASREWDGMGDLERKPFIRSAQNVNFLEVNSYVRYLLHSRYSADMSFDPKSGKGLGKVWKSMTPGEQSKFSAMDTSESGIAHVIRKRDSLHQSYDPKQLCILEFILKTKPKWPLSSRLWFFRHESQSISSLEAKQKWNKLTDDERAIYNRCAILDRKRYKFEKNAWVTNLLAIDIDNDEFTLSDFYIPDVKSKIDSLGSFVEMSRDLPDLIGLKRPRNAFSLFIEAYRYQIRDERPEFQFGKHLKECSHAWNKLSDEEKNVFLEESKKLKEKRRDFLSRSSNANDTRLTVPIDLFSTTKSSFGPCRPSHLYQRVDSPMQIWRKETFKTATKDLKKKWGDLTDREKEPYMKKHKQMKEACDKQKLEIDQKHTKIKILLREAAKLEDIKQKLRLVGCPSKEVKNLYS